MAKRFKQEVLEEIKKDPLLYGNVAEAMGIGLTSMPMAIKRNGPTINQYSIVTLVASHLGKEPEELLEEESADTVDQAVGKESSE